MDKFETFSGIAAPNAIGQHRHRYDHPKAVFENN